MLSPQRIAVALAIVALSFSGSLAAHADEATPDAAMVYAVNSHRNSVGLGQLSRDSVLDSIATTHAKRMAATDRIFHNRRLRSEITAALPSWRLAGENVGVGVTADQVEQLFLESASHRANIERSSYQRLGVGVAPTADGRLYFVQVFALTSNVPAVNANAENNAPQAPINAPAGRIRAASGPQALAAPVPDRVVPMPGVQFVNQESTNRAPTNRRAGMFVAVLTLLALGVGVQKLRERARMAARISLPPAAHGKAFRPRPMVRG